MEATLVTAGENDVTLETTGGKRMRVFRTSLAERDHEYLNSVVLFDLVSCKAYCVVERVDNDPHDKTVRRECQKLVVEYRYKTRTSLLKTTAPRIAVALLGEDKTSGGLKWVSIIGVVNKPVSIRAEEVRAADIADVCERYETVIDRDTADRKSQRKPFPAHKLHGFIFQIWHAGGIVASHTDLTPDALKKLQVPADWYDWQKYPQILERDRFGVYHHHVGTK